MIEENTPIVINFLIIRYLICNFPKRPGQAFIYNSKFNEVLISALPSK